MDRNSTHKELWEKLRAGNEQALYDLYREFYHSLFYTGLKICREGELVKECINQVFLYFWEKHETLNPAENVGAYIHTSFRRRLLAALQVQKKYNRKIEESVVADEWATPSHEAYLIEMQNREELKKRVTKAVNRLSKRKQELVKLHYYEGLSYEEIADKTGLSLRTIYNKLHEAIKALKQELGRAGNDSSIPVGLLFTLCF